MDPQGKYQSPHVNKLLDDIVRVYYRDCDPKQIRRFEKVTTEIKDVMIRKLQTETHEGRMCLQSQTSITSSCSPVFEDTEEVHHVEKDSLSINSTVIDSVDDSAFFDNLRRHEALSFAKVEEKTNKEKFVKTSSFKIAMEFLSEKRRIIITGNPGDGKSTVAYQCLKRYIQTNQKISRRPWLVYREEDLLIVGPKDNLTILIDGPFDHVTMSRVPLKLLETLAFVTCENQSNQFIIVMQKEVLQLYQSNLKTMDWFSDDIVVDLSREKFSPKVQFKFLQIYLECSEEKLNEFVSPTKFYSGFPELCKILSKKENQSFLNFSDASVELYGKHFDEFESLPLALLSAVLMNNGSLKIEDFLDGFPNEKFYDDLSVLLGWRYDRIQANNMIVVAKSFEGIYLSRSESKYTFINNEVSEAVANVLYRKNPWKFIDVCPVNTFANFVTKPNHKGLRISEEMCKRVITRFLFEIEANPTSVLFESIWQCSIWKNHELEKFTGGRFAKSVQKLDRDMQSSFYQQSAKYRNVGLISYLLIYIPELLYTGVGKGSPSLRLASPTSIQEDLFRGLREKCSCSLYWRILRKRCAHSTECLFTHTLSKDIINIHAAIKSNSEHLCCFINLGLEFLLTAKLCSFPDGESANHTYKINICRMKSMQILPMCLHRKFENSVDGRCILDGCKNSYFWMYKHMLESGAYINKIFNSIFVNAIQRKNLPFRNILIRKALKAFSSIYGRKCRILDLWMGQRYLKSKASLTDTLVVILGLRELYNLPKTFLGLSLLVRNDQEVSSEASSIVEHENVLHNSDIKLSDEIISNLFSSHSNISLVSSSSVRSMGYHSDSPKIVSESCVVIYCRIKGVIPDNESSFPSEIGGYPVDVRESICHFANNPESLRMGDAIYVDSSKQFGTVGVFVDIDQSTKGFITCAHVFCPSYVLSRGSCQKYFDRIELDWVKVYDRENTQSENSMVGKLMKPVFTNNNSNKVSVDAAIVEFTARKPQHGQFTDNFKMNQLKQAGFSPQKLPTFCSGEIECITSSIFTNKVIKFGAKSGLTVGHFRKDLAHAQVTKYHKILTPKKTGYKMFHQIEIFPQGKDKFFDEGDSGSCIFITDDTNPTELKCIGLGVAVTSHGSCIMTPIKHVLDSLGLKHDSLTKFPADDESDESSIMGSGTLKILMEKLNEIKDSTILNTEKLEKIDQRLSSQSEDIKELKGRVSLLEDK